MGLIGGYFTSCYAGVHLVCASPFDFISHPLLWADMVEKYKADFTCAPNFAFALLLRRLEQTQRISDWNHVKRAVFGGEPTNAGVVQKVITKLNMEPQNVWNMYGIAECGLCVTAGVAELGDDGLVSCGLLSDASIAGEVRIVKDGNAVEDGREGVIWVQSSRVASGYYGQKKKTQQTFQNRLSEGSGFEQGRWLDTGDIGKIINGSLYVTGRAKDVIIVNGKNYYPTDVEQAVDLAFSSFIRPGRTASFQIGDATIGVTVETRKTTLNDQDKGIEAQIASQILSSQGILVQTVLVLKPGCNPKTTSG